MFNPDWTCNPNKKPFQYAVGGIYEEDVKPSVCDRGFHFYEKAADCFNYYPFNPENKVAEVLALGEVDTNGRKFCTNKIQIVREIPWAELLEIVNTEKSCTGFCNSGNWNSGDWNKTNFSNECFNTVEPEIYLFNKPSNWTYRDWIASEAYSLLQQIPKNVLNYIQFKDMTEIEKEAHPETKTTGGYLKILDNSESELIWWRSLLEHEKAVIKAIPNFDAKIFEEITGI